MVLGPDEMLPIEEQARRVVKSSQDFNDFLGLSESIPIQIPAGIRYSDHSHGLRFLLDDVEQAIVLTKEVLALLVSVQRLGARPHHVGIWEPFKGIDRGLCVVQERFGRGQVAELVADMPVDAGDLVLCISGQFDGVVAHFSACAGMRGPLCSFRQSRTSDRLLRVPYPA